MPLVTIHNLRSTRLVLPVVSLAARGSTTLSLTAAELEAPTLVAAERAGLIMVEAVQDSAVNDVLELATRADLNAIGVVEVDVGAEVANARTLTCSLVDLAGRPILEARHVLVQTISDSDNQGDIGETLAPIGTFLNRKADAAGVESLAWITTTTEGTFDFTVTVTVAEGCAVKIAADGCLNRVLRLNFA